MITLKLYLRIFIWLIPIGVIDYKNQDAELTKLVELLKKKYGLTFFTTRKLHSFLSNESTHTFKVGKFKRIRLYQK